MQLLKGKKALITGGTSGIGREIACLFAEQGASVVVFGTNPERGAQVVEEMQKRKISEDQNFTFRAVNVSDKKSVEEAIQELINSWTNIDILVNNAGITRDGLLMKMSEQDWDEVIDVNLKSLYNICQVLIRPMMKARNGKIINISSVVGLTGNAGQVNYASSKAGIIGFTKALAQEVATRNIQVNSVAPGMVETPMTAVLNEKQREGVLNKIPMGRMGQPREIANAVLYLASELSNYMTGQVLAVDGGMVM